MMDWSNEPIGEYKKVEYDWNKIWTENKELELVIDEDEKGYQLELKNTIRICNNTVKFMKQRFMFYTEAMELAHNEKTL